MSSFHPFVPRAIRTFRESFPGVSVRLEEEISNELVERLRNGRIDVAFTRTPVAHPDGLVVSSLLEEPMLLALPSEHVLAGSSHNCRAAVSYTRRLYVDLTFLARSVMGSATRIGFRCTEYPLIMKLGRLRGRL